MVNEMIVSIDGPAGAGKSSISKEVAKKLKLTYIDTGAMYRALTYKAIENNIDIFDEKKLEKTLLDSEIELVSDFEEDILKIYLDKKEITNEIRTPAVSQAVSEVSTHKKIREIMVQKQRDIANSRGNVILDGRDIGTVVFPFADVKIFLTASVNERAKRRLMELEEKGLEINLDELIKEMKKRDRQDTEREFSPLKPADDAIIVDTTDLKYDEVKDKIVDIIDKILKIKEIEGDNFPRQNDFFSEIV